MSIKLNCEIRIERVNPTENEFLPTFVCLAMLQIEVFSSLQSLHESSRSVTTSGNNNNSIT